MTNFPAFRPREFGALQHGEFPAVTVKTMGGVTATTVLSDKEYGRRIQLTFDLTTDQWQQIIAHVEEKGTVKSFSFNSVTVPSSSIPAGYKARYESAPAVEDLYTNFFRVSCVFILEFYPNFTQASNTLPLFVRPVETTPTIVPAAAPPAPTLSIAGLANGNTNQGIADVSGLQLGASWEYSLNGGSTWQTGSGTSFRVPEGSYAAGDIRVRQTNTAGTSTAAQNAAAVAVNSGATVTLAFSCNNGATATGSVTLPKVGWFLQVKSSHAGWLRIYASGAAASSDAARTRSQHRPTASGVELDFIWGTPALRHLSPLESFQNSETPSTTTYQYRFVNDGSSGQVVITLSYRV